jgi:hypothetical protein
MLPRHTPDLERWAGLTLSAVIALGCCSLLVLLRWRFRINLTIRPYLWMALLGMCLLPLMPVGVGLATLGLSLLLPLLQRWC